VSTARRCIKCRNPLTTVRWRNRFRAYLCAGCNLDRLYDVLNDLKNAIWEEQRPVGERPNVENGKSGQPKKEGST
jgi:hypothetical protein